MRPAFLQKNVYSIILCGGSGTRLWPLSRKGLPKQFLNLGGSPQSLLELCLARIKNISPPSKRWIVTCQDQEGLCKNQIGHLVSRFIVEPSARNTAAAIAYAAWELLKEDPHSIMIILPSDHVIQNVRSFEQTLADSVALAEHNFFVTIGIPPTHPSTSFGYIEQGLPLDIEGRILPFQKTPDIIPTGYSVRSFREKPSQAAAEQFLRTGKYLWNAGIFVWKTKTFWDAFSHIQPEMTQVISQSHTAGFDKLYDQLEKTQIDVAFIEQTSHVACVPAHFDWSDVGSWSAVRECFTQDSEGNTTSGDIPLLNTKNSVVHSTGPFASVVGMDNVAVVATADAVLVIPLDFSQDVKKVTSYLEKNKRELM